MVELEKITKIHIKLSFQKIKKTVLAVVCDGMGGARAGQTASGMACEIFAETVMSRTSEHTDKKLEGLLKEAVSLANIEIFEKSCADERFAGMGTTMVAAMCKNGKTMLLNVGDSRAYFIDAEGIVRITRDHSLVEDMVQRGTITELEAQTHPNKNVITRAVGTEREICADIYTKELKNGEYILLCSDGLSNLLNEQEMLYEVLYGEPESACERLCEIANSRGGFDNITVVLITK